MSLHAYQLTLSQAAGDIAEFLAPIVCPPEVGARHLGAERLVDGGSCWIGWMAPNLEGVCEHVALFRRRRTSRGFILEPTVDGLAGWGARWLPRVAQLGEELSSLPEWATDIYTTKGNLIAVDAVPNVRVVG